MSRLTVLDTLDSITHKAAQSGVRLEVIDNPDFIYLLWIERMRGPKGSAREAILDLCEFADRERKRISLFAENEQLVGYYQSLGFQRSLIPHFLRGVGMERLPR